MSDAFLADLLARMRQIGRADIWIAVPPESSIDRMALRYGSGVRWLSQGDGDLGERMGRVVKIAFQEGASGVVLLGGDHPNLPVFMIERCFDALERGRAAWIRTEDGGYAALALPKEIPDLFIDIPWSTSAVAEATLQRARALGIEIEHAGMWYDVDRPEDLLRLERDLQNESSCPRTRALFSEWKLESRKEGIFPPGPEAERRHS
jgi:glycosyltransferase A (GT-A) superfamily protein (DUF2064 family)